MSEEGSSTSWVSAITVDFFFSFLFKINCSTPSSGSSGDSVNTRLHLEKEASSQAADTSKEPWSESRVCTN